MSKYNVWDTPLDEMIAVLLYYGGFQYGVSSGISGEVTFGYGYLSDYGYWQYPLSQDHISYQRK